jgi:excisionase family DNA binding protein
MPHKQFDDTVIRGQQYFSTSGVAKQFRCTEWTVRQWICHGRLKAVKVGGRYFVSKDAVSAMMGCGEQNNKPAQHEMDAGMTPM